MENKITEQLLAHFPELDGKISVPRPMRISIDWVDRLDCVSILTYLKNEMGFWRGHNIIGTDEGNDLGFIYLVSGDDNIIVSIRTKAPKSDPHIPSVSNELYPSFVLFERELIDLFGAHVDGLHPGRRYPLPDQWPKDQWPLRKEWKKEDFVLPLNDIEEVRKDEPAIPPINENLITVPIGPQHPSLDEPGSFAITLSGEKVEGAEIGIGYNHRGLEKACENNTYIQDLYIIERVCGICSHAHTSAYCMAVEELSGVEAPRRAQYIRLIAAELERLHSHLLWLGVAGHEIGFDTLFMLSWRDRERVLDLLAVLGGNRINYGINCLGGVRRDIDDKLRNDIIETLQYLEKEVLAFIKLATSEATLMARLENVGPLSYEDCKYYGATGPVARAAGIAQDIRVIEPYGAYREIRTNVITDEHADVFGRTVVRLKEMLESIRLIREAVNNLPDGPLTVRVPRRIPEGEAIVRIEAPRGEDIHYVRSNGTDKPDRIRVRAPSECNWHGMQHMLEGGYLSDVPITIAAIDPCYSCTDRAIELYETGEASVDVIDWKTLRKKSIAWYEKRGIDFSKVKL